MDIPIGYWDMDHFVTHGKADFWRSPRHAPWHDHLREAITLSFLKIEVPKLNPRVTPMSWFQKWAQNSPISLCFQDIDTSKHRKTRANVTNYHVWQTKKEIGLSYMRFSLFFSIQLLPPSIDNSINCQRIL